MLLGGGLKIENYTIIYFFELFKNIYLPSYQFYFKIKKMNKNSNKRTTPFWSTDLPLTSNRVRIILSNPSDSHKLSQSIRAKRAGSDKSFTVSSATKSHLTKRK